MKILLVDDDEVDRLRAERALRDATPRPTFLHARDATSALAALAAAPDFDCVILDYHLPGKTGLDLLREIRAAKQDVPVIVLTGQGDEETAVEIMKAGASDYLSKGTMVPERLRQSVFYAVRNHRIEAETRRATRALDRYADQLRMLAAAATEMHGELSVDAVTRAIADHARRIIGAEAAVARVTSLSRGRDVKARVGEGSSVEPIPPAALERCVRMTRAELDADPLHLAIASADDGPLPSRGWLAAPLTGADGTRIGVVHLSDKKDGEFVATDEAILVQLAQIGSVAASNARLFEAEKAATRQRDDMVALVSHDLRGPLNTIVMGSSLLQSLTPKSISVAHATILRIQRAAGRMNGLIGDLLDMTRIQSGVLVVDPVVEALAALLEDALDPYRPVAEEKKIALRIAMADGDHQVKADRARILQVISNLIDNALKFTPSEGEVTLGSTAHDGLVVISVSDTGAGIAAEDLPHLFDRHWQAKEGAKLGAGLGLYIAKGIVEAHGGTIRATSRVGEGTTFSFTLGLSG